MAAAILIMPAPPLGAAASPPRSLREVFPSLSDAQRRAAFSSQGLRHTFAQGGQPALVPAAGSGIDILTPVMDREPIQIVESLLVIPRQGRALTKLDAYNAIGRIQNISDHYVFSRPRNAYIPLFEESTRLEDGRRNRPIPDPPPSAALPASETVHLRLRDAYFGNTYLRGTFSAGERGITYHLTNSAAVRFLVFPVMREERFVTVIYVEPIWEGLLVYSMAGIAIPEFLVPMVNLPFNVDRRLTILTNWLTDGLDPHRRR